MHWNAKLIPQLFDLVDQKRFLEIKMPHSKMCAFFIYLFVCLFCFKRHSLFPEEGFVHNASKMSLTSSFEKCVFENIVNLLFPPPNLTCIEKARLKKEKKNSLQWLFEAFCQKVQDCIWTELTNCVRCSYCCNARRTNNGR